MVLGALQQWGDRYLPRPSGPTIERRQRETGAPLHVGFVAGDGHEVALPDVEFARTPAYPAAPAR